MQEGTSLVFKPASSGNPTTEVYIARRRLQDAYARDLFELWKDEGKQILKQVAREQPGTLVKCLTQLMPREFKAESSVEIVGRFSDEQLASMIAELNERIERRLSGADAKVINANVETGAAVLPPPANEACDTTSRLKRNPKSTPERLAYAREYKRRRKAGNPNAAAAARAAAQAAKKANAAS